MDFLLKELKDYWDLFNPYCYVAGTKPPANESTRDMALKRIAMYQSYFKGWSMYEVDGVWKANGRMDEERTQIIRIMFRLPSKYTQMAKDADCEDVLRSMLYWCIGRHGNTYEHQPCSKEEERQFLRRQHPWVRRKKDFVRKYFKHVARETLQWRHDGALLVYGFLVRKFGNSVLSQGADEQEIWVTNFFNLHINVVRRAFFIY